MSEKQLFALIHGLWSDVQQPDFIWQVAALMLSLGLAWWLARMLRRQIGEPANFVEGAVNSTRDTLRDFGTHGLRRVSFPLLALLLVFLCRLLLRRWGHVGLLDLAIPLLLSLALVRATIYILRQAFTSSQWLAASERFIALSIWLCLALYITGLADQLIELLEQVGFRVGKQNLNLWMLFHGAVTILATVLLALWVAGVVEHRLLAAARIDSSIKVVLARLVKAMFSVLALLFSLSLVGIDITALSVFGGAFAVGLGFGLQKIASNYVSGFIILLDRSIRLGNVITVDAGTSGIVTQITTRYTVVRTLGGSEYIIPNEYLVGNIIQNQSFTDTRVRLASSLCVAYGTDLAQAMHLMEAAAQAQTRVLADPPPKAQLTAFADSGLQLELGFWIADPQEGTGNVRSDVNLAIWQAFSTHGIEIPFPQREVRLLGTRSVGG